MNYAALVFLAIAIEGLIQWLKKEYRNKWSLLALLLALVGVVAIDFNPLVRLGVQPADTLQAVAVAVLGFPLAAVAIARGSNYLNDFVALLKR